ncbi:hypothetical protein Plhal304r1_c077g0164041 [Plasmopara halstedii]
MLDVLDNKGQHGIKLFFWKFKVDMTIDYCSKQSHTVSGQERALMCSTWLKEAVTV